MAEITIKFRHNPKSGKREMIINYESEHDALPHEHERDHKAAVEALLGQKLGDDDKVIVQRLDKEGNVVSESEVEPAGRETVANKG
jgi:hypothetical protein